MVTDQLKEVQETFGKEVQNGWFRLTWRMAEAARHVCAQWGVMACSVAGLGAGLNDKDLMEQVKTLLAARQREHSSPSKVLRLPRMGTPLCAPPAPLARLAGCWLVIRGTCGD